MAVAVTLVSVVGARPQFVKLAPISRAIERMPDVVHRVVHTGQHYDDSMSASFFEQLELPRPDLDLGVGSGSHATQTGAMLTKLESYLAEHPPQAVLTYGDTNSTLAATLAASKIHVPVAHIEAGLRSYNRAMPEEINRLVADHCSDRLYAPTPQALRNLGSENLADRAVLSGDVMLDAVLRNIDLAHAGSRALDELGLREKRFGLVTVHRPVNTGGDALAHLLDALEETAAHLELLFPVHPRTRAMLDTLGYEPPKGLRLLGPLPYLDSILLIQHAAVVITDSGGVQKEAAFLHTPCLTMRDETEWTETVGMGVNRLVGNAASGGLADAVAAVLEAGDPFDAETLGEIRRQYGSGDAAQMIVRDCIDWLS